MEICIKGTLIKKLEVAQRKLLAGDIVSEQKVLVRVLEGDFASELCVLFNSSRFKFIEKVSIGDKVKILANLKSNAVISSPGNYYTSINAYFISKIN